MVFKKIPNFLFCLTVALASFCTCIEELPLAIADKVDAITRFSFEGQALRGLTAYGDYAIAEGVEGNSIWLDGDSVLKIKSDRVPTSRFMSLSMWVNVHRLTGDQQMLAAKNVYSLGQREWSVMVDRNGHFCLYLYQNGWKVIDSGVKPTLGHWYRIGLVFRDREVEFWVNEKITTKVDLDRSIPDTLANVTLGGVDDNGRIWQCFHGAIDEVTLLHRSLDAKEMIALHYPVDRVHALPEPIRPFHLWTGAKIPSASKIEKIKGVEFRVIKRHEPEVDGFGFLHGVALAWHKNRLYCSFGHNKGSENTLTEEGRFCYSDDAGETWSPVMTIDAGIDQDDLAVSHGVFLSHQGTLWAFLGSFYGTRKDVHTRAYTLDEESGAWEPRGTVVEDGFWPMTEPVRMVNGSWVMPGFVLSGNNPPAVAISNGEDFLSWDLRVIPLSGDVKNLWGESSVVVSGSEILNVARYGAKAVALASRSDDYGLSWAKAKPADLPMATSKPCCGTLSNGVRYLICSVSSDGGGRRSPLTIALGRPGERGFSRLLTIRDAIDEQGPGESHANAALSYPYATEHQRKLYVGYSNNGPRRGNNNSAEMAIIPLSALSLD